MVKDKRDGGGWVNVPCKDRHSQTTDRATADVPEKKNASPVRDTIPPPPLQKPDKK